MILLDCASIDIIELLPSTEGGQGLSLLKILNSGRGLKTFSVKRGLSKSETFSVDTFSGGYWFIKSYGAVACKAHAA